MSSNVLSITHAVNPRSQLRTLTDAEIIKCCQRGDQIAFKELVRRYEGVIGASLFRNAPDWPDRSDLMQEVLIRIWRGINRLQNPLAFKSWLNQIITNLFYDELRKRPRRPNLISLDQVPEGDDGQERATRDIEDTSDGPEALYHRKEFDAAVHKLIDLLPKQFKTVIVLRELEGLSYEEISVLTGSDLGTVKSRISRARMKLQTLLTPYLNDSNTAKAA